MERETPEQAMVERIADRQPKALRELRALEMREVEAGRDPADSMECEDALSVLVSWVEENLPGIDDLDADTFLEDLIGQAVERVCGPMPGPTGPDAEAERVARSITNADDAGMAQDVYLNARTIYRSRGESVPPVVVEAMRARFVADALRKAMSYGVRLGRGEVASEPHALVACGCVGCRIDGLARSVVGEEWR